MEERKKKEERGNRKKEEAIKQKPRNKMTNNLIIANLVFICPRGHVHLEVVIFVIFYLPSNICLYRGLFLCTFKENGTHKTRMNT